MGYVLVKDEEYYDIKKSYDKYFGEVASRLTSIVGLLTNYDLDGNCYTSDWNYMLMDPEDRFKKAIDTAKDLHDFLLKIDAFLYLNYDREEID